MSTPASPSAGPESPRFSVVIPTLNRAHLLPQAIHSVLAQTCADLELVIVDDGSTDDTEAVVTAIGDPRIRYQRQVQTGVSAARNAGAAAARGEFLVFLDSDDELLPIALELYSAALREPGRHAVAAARISVSADRRDWHTWIPRGLGFLPGAFAVSKEAFTGVGGYDEKLRYSENTELGWRVKQYLAAHAMTMGLVEEPVVVRYTQASREYDVAKYEAARWILDHPDQPLDSPTAGVAAPRKRRATYQSIVAVNAAQLGRRREAFAASFAAIGNDPLSFARYRNLAGVTRRSVARDRANGFHTAAPGTAPERAAKARATADAGEPGAIHGVLVTFNRPDSLARMIDDLADIGLTSLTVVDNAPSEESEEIARRASTVVPTTYVPMGENTGPAGGNAAGMTSVLETAADNDWILILDDDRLTGPGDTARNLRDFGEFLAARGTRVGAVGQVGSRFDRRRGRLLRLSDDDLAGPVRVDYVAGNQMLMLSVGAVREVGVFDSTLFFGFDDLDYCERLRVNGYGIYVLGSAGMDARRRFGRLGPDVRPALRRESVWRRYYGVRNHVVIMRRYTTAPRAAFVTVGNGVVRPVLDLVRGNASPALVVAGTRGCVDAWRNRLGRTMEPPSASEPLPGAPSPN